MGGALESNPNPIITLELLKNKKGLGKMHGFLLVDNMDRLGQMLSPPGWEIKIRQNK